MPYLSTYCAYIRFTDGSRHEWTGLRKTQARWRYYWIDRNLSRDAIFQGKQFDEFGWKREFQA